MASSTRKPPKAMQRGSPLSIQPRVQCSAECCWIEFTVATRLGTGSIQLTENKK
jgi:hypothetical protein